MAVIMWFLLYAAQQLMPAAEPQAVWVCAGSSDALRSQAYLDEAIRRGQCRKVEVTP